MPLSDLRLSLLAFPQKWDGNGGLDLNLVVVPVGDPFSPLTPTGPRFAGTKLALRAVVIRGVDDLPSATSISTTVPLSTPLPANQQDLFGTFLGAYPIDEEPIRRPIGPDVRVRKNLPPSYLAAAGIDAPGSDDTTIGDEFGCSLLGQDPGSTRRGTIPPSTISWGALLSFSLRQPRLAEELGLVYRIPLSVDATTFEDGGWVYVEISPAAGSPYAADAAATPALIRSYAARIPPLTSTPRPLFAAVLFPVVPAVVDPAAYDEADLEAQTYDSGFASIVHCDQPITFNAATGDHGTLAPATDAGIQVGWDDEQVTAWHNRQLDIARARQAASDPKAEIPLGVLGYRVDVSEDDGVTWSSLCLATREFAFGALRGIAPFEASVEPVPTRANHPDALQAWLPRYFAQWRGGSLAGDDPVIHEMTAGGSPPPQTSLRPLPPSVSLTYGRRYSFRVRLADLSGGGPEAGDQDAHPGVAAAAHLHFRRFVTPKAIRVATTPTRPPMPLVGEAVTTPATPTLTALEVLRPLLGYPEMRFAGLGEADLLRFRQQIAVPTASTPGDPAVIFGIPDPDVDTLYVIVEARSLAHDEGGDPPLDGAFRILYELERPFPPRAADPLADGAPLRLQLDYVEVATVSSLVAPATGLTLPIPTARDVRIRLRGINRGGPPDYFGNEAARAGITVDFLTRREATAENGLLLQVGPHGVEAFYLQPGANTAQLLAQHLGLDVRGATFSGRPGVRTVFGASRFIRHHLSGDHSTLTLATREELLHQWIVVIRFDLARDWTWDGLADSGIIVERQDAGPDPLGTIEPRRTLSAAALAEGDESQRRESTHLVFFDAVNPLPVEGSFPGELHVHYLLRTKLTGSAAAPIVTLDELRLPVSVRPAQVPRLASAGIALSPYRAATDYSTTESRRRYLWLEFAEPIADPADALFARVLAYAQDPLLDPRSQAPDLAEEPPISLPDEAIRVIVPDQSRDDAGLAPMKPLIPALPSDRHFLLPLPEGVSSASLALFGLWTYELRIGHLREWSTAQARFGRPLRVAGVQHPAPPLLCTAGHSAAPPGVIATAPLATPVAEDGTSGRARGDTGRSSMYFLLYAQARQTDGFAWRNILLLTQPGFIRDSAIAFKKARDLRAETLFSAREIAQTLALLLLPTESPLSVVAVELMPSGESPPEEPMTRELGQVRILRTSPLTAVQPICPPETAPLAKVLVHPGLPLVVQDQAPDPVP